MWTIHVDNLFSTLMNGPFTFKLPQREHVTPEISRSLAGWQVYWELPEGFPKKSNGDRCVNKLIVHLEQRHASLVSRAVWQTLLAIGPNPNADRIIVVTFQTPHPSSIVHHPSITYHTPHKLVKLIDSADRQACRIPIVAYSLPIAIPILPITHQPFSVNLNIIKELVRLRLELQGQIEEAAQYLQVMDSSDTEGEESESSAADGENTSSEE